tara:strand:+ start:949 stop:1182 length:234 start_codon:yes stop_codon:yes gene_type:complete
MSNEKLEKMHNIDGKEIKESDLSEEQHFHKNHIISLRNKIAKLQFEMDDLIPGLQYHEQAIIDATKEQAKKSLDEES